VPAPTQAELVGVVGGLRERGGHSLQVELGGGIGVCVARPEHHGTLLVREQRHAHRQRAEH
jgi:hypothetical protein